MSIQPDENIVDLWSPIVIASSSDMNITVTITDPDTGLPIDLSTYTVRMIVKPSRYASDGQGSTFLGNVTLPTAGVVEITIPQSELPLPSVSWYRIDILSGSEIITTNFGPFNVLAA